MTLPPLRDTIDEQAARWTARLDGGTLSTTDRLALYAWLDEDPAHRAAFEHYQLICDDTAESLPALAQASAVARPDAVPDRPRRWWLPWTAGLAAAAGLAVFWALPHWRNAPSVATVAAQRSVLALPDGSRAELNARTSLLTDFRGERRRVRLERGEAFFSVASDPAHPFLVETPAGTVRVTGTRFNVRLGAGARPEVTLVEGAVTVENGVARLQLSPGEQLTAAGALRRLDAGEIANALAWREGRIVLTGLTLAEAAQRFEEFHGRRITVEPSVAALRLGGSLGLEDLGGFFDALSAEPLGLKVVRRDTEHYAIVRP